MVTNSEARKRKEEALNCNDIDSLKHEIAVYREYYLSTEESFRLSETKGVSDDEWNAHHERYSRAIRDCDILEAKKK